MVGEVVGGWVGVVVGCFGGRKADSSWCSGGCRIAGAAAGLSTGVAVGLDKRGH